MQIVLKHCKISLSNKVNFYFCSSFSVGKSLKLLSHASKFVYSPLELVFTYLWGPAHLTLMRSTNIMFPLLMLVVYLDISNKV